MSGVWLTRSKRWTFAEAEWFSCAEDRKPLRDRFGFFISVGWQCPGLGLSFRFGPARETRQVAIGLGLLHAKFLIFPVPRCPCCGGDPDAPSDDCLAHPSADEAETSR